MRGLILEKGNEDKEVINVFRRDVIRGLSADPKHLMAKYFYDHKGDEIFQQIMSCEEYYPTRCELEILQKCSKEITKECLLNSKHITVIELGAGDGSKSVFLLKELKREYKDLEYIPIDISDDIVQYVNRIVPQQIQGLLVNGLTGEYFDTLAKVNPIFDNTNKLVLFLGSTIGNMDRSEIDQFISNLRSYLSSGDMVLIGFDLTKSPEIILRAYNDKEGYTRAFNLNLLTRINRELNADFNVHQFAHFPIYNKMSGACESYLMSLIEQDIHIGKATFHFKEKEMMFMEVSQKFTIPLISELAKQNQFKLLNNYSDSKNWFVDSLWQVI